MWNILAHFFHFLKLYLVNLLLTIINQTWLSLGAHGSFLMTYLNKPEKFVKMGILMQYRVLAVGGAVSAPHSWN